METINAQTVQEAQSVLEALPSVTVVVLVALVVVGLVLWVMGRKLARPACAVSGLVLGGLAGFAAGQTLRDQGAYVIPLVIGAGIAGALLASLLFRVWMAVSGAAILALAAPAMVLVWQGTPLAIVPAEDGEAAEAQVAEAEPADPPAEAGEGEADAGEVVTMARTAAQNWYDEQAERVRAWWDELGPGGHRVVYGAAAVGGLIGLVIGLIAPYLAASFETALVGSILLLLPGRELAAYYAPGVAGFLPQSPRALLVWLGLITVLGFLLQWTLYGRRTDK